MPEDNRNWNNLANNNDIEEHEAISVHLKVTEKQSREEMLFNFA